ncbi:MAG: hypothetical protein JXB07_14020 [Anaerolineae bacterium]|nr:hypothetical protein [Anaerolineae bacterium]
MRHSLAQHKHLTIVIRPVILVLGLCLLLAPVHATHAQDTTPTVTPSPVDEVGSDFYGINFINPIQPWLRIGYESGARVVRWQFNWRDHELGPGDWDWTKSDSAIAAWNRTGIKVHAIMHNPPPFALVDPGGLMPINLDAPYTSTQVSFSRFCYTFAQRYKGQVYSYEVWNEPDLPHYWNGTAAQYATLLKGCYQGIKAADPAAIVVTAGMAYITDLQFYTAVIRQLARDPQAPANHYYFDAVAVHMYGDPELVYSHTNNVRNVLTGYGIRGKPIWITETNVALRGADSPPHQGFGTEEEVGWYVLQATSNAYAAGAEKLMLFRLNDHDMGEMWGLVKNNGTPRSGYRALQLAATVLRDITEANREVAGGVVITTMRRADNARIVTLYSQTGESATVAVKAETTAAVLINSAGGYATVEPDDEGFYNITLPPAHGRDMNRLESYSVGGPVMIVVELDRTPPTTTVQVSVLPHDKTHVMVRWRGDDGKFGTGVATYDVEYSVDGDFWLPLQTETTETQIIHDISQGGTFAFRARAVDRVGNQGEFSEPILATLQLIGKLIAKIVDLRGQGVPSARVELADGTLYDADGAGWVRIDLPPGIAEIARVDGSVHGQVVPPPVEIVLDEETTVTWMVMPQQNLIEEGNFEKSLGDWVGLALGDIQQATTDDPLHPTVLRLTGQRHPWGSPTASLKLDIPAGMDEAILSFYYRLPGDGQAFRLRVVTEQGHQTLWQINAMSPEFTRVWLDVGDYAGQTIDLRFELWGSKDSPASSAEIDDLLLANVPVVP